ncbi:hypothetical protein AB4Z45_07480 [Paenibacillus sp. MCAF9]|uniref:hypothetical protein n=1 Tax=Paenibacillus sp. MCAF9 TaxID=3233046 RepID=UPI003F9C6526
MSYDIHITRANHWTDSADNPISLEELKTYFAAKKDFEYSNLFSIAGPFNISIDGEFFIWSYEDIKVPFSYSKGRITVPEAEGEVMDKMKEIATELQAIVQGDEGEAY